MPRPAEPARHARYARVDVMSDWRLGWWLVHPKEWGSHPFVSGLPPMVAALVLLVVFAFAFWIKDKFWP
jgi:hypothetical protein